MEKTSAKGKKMDDITCEDDLKKLIEPILQKDFDLFPEVWGKHLIEGNTVRIDYISYPKQEIIESGFPPIYFGIEVKHIPISDETGGGDAIEKLYQTIKQAIFYSNAMFTIEKETKESRYIRCRPALVFVFSNLFLKEINNPFLIQEEQYLRGMLRCAASQKVGTLKIRKTEMNIEYEMFLYSLLCSVSNNMFGRSIKPPNTANLNRLYKITPGSRGKSSLKVLRKNLVEIVNSNPFSIDEDVLYYPD